MNLRDQLHGAIDQLPDAQLNDACSLLAALRAQAAAASVLAGTRAADVDAWQRAAIEDALSYADGTEAEWIGQDELLKWLRSWGAEEELPPPTGKRTA